MRYLYFISGEDLVTNPAMCHDKIHVVNQQFAACSGSPPQCSTFSSIKLVAIEFPCCGKHQFCTKIA